MDPADSWRLRTVAEPVSYYDTDIRQWTSGSFDTAVKSEHPAARSSGVSASPEPGSLGGLRRGQLQSDVNPDEQAELRRQESGAAPQPMPALYQAPPPSAAFAGTRRATSERGARPDRSVARPVGAGDLSDDPYGPVLCSTGSR